MISSEDVDDNEYTTSSSSTMDARTEADKGRKRKLFEEKKSQSKSEQIVIHDQANEKTSPETKAECSASKRRCRKIFQDNTDDTVSPFTTLPNELMSHLILYLNPMDIGRLSCTCRRLQTVIQQNFVWKSLCRRRFPYWNDKVFDTQISSESSANLAINPYIGSCWKRQYALNHTKAIFYQTLGGSGRGKTMTKIMNTPAAYGFSKICCSRDHVFALDFACVLHVYRSRWERDPVTNEFTYKRATWHKEFAKHVVDVTTDKRYDNSHRRYVYVLSQSLNMRSKRLFPNTRSSSAEPAATGWNSVGVPQSGDKIDVFDERSCRRVFNMTFDPEMRFTSIQLTSAESQQKTLFMLTDAGKVYSLHLYEPSLLNLGSDGIQVTLKSASKCLGEKVEKIKTSVGIVAFVTVTGKMHVMTQRPGEFYDLFGRENSVKLGTLLPIQHVAKVVQCSLGDRHIGFQDEYGRAFVLGNNRYGQLGTGDRMDRSSPTQILFNRRTRILHCSLNHTLVVVESNEKCEVLGAGCGNNGRLPGRSRGSVEFVKLDITVPWSVRQIDTHKECLYALSCRDIFEVNQFKETQIANQGNKLFLAHKSQQELMMDMKKTKNLSNKIKILEEMINKISKQTTSFNQFKPIGHSKKPILVSQALHQGQDILQHCNSTAIKDSDMAILRHAAEHLRHEVDRVQLDHHILNQPSRIDM